MIPFSFFIPREPSYETLAPAVSDSTASDMAHVPCKTSRHVSERDLYFGLDLDIETMSKWWKKKALIKKN